LAHDRSNRIYSELANSCESTSAFFAAFRARVQSPLFAASRASAMKLRTFDARSCCVAFRGFPPAVAMFRSAMLRLWPVCCCAALVSAAVSCGAIWGTSGLLATSLGGGLPAGTRGRGGALCGMASAEGGATTSVASSSGLSLSSKWYSEALGAKGRAYANVLHGKGLAFVLCSAHPPSSSSNAHEEATLNCANHCREW
jgi:hypothetical protein